MPILLCASLAMLRTAPKTSWFGPVTATFTVQFSGNPYDPQENDVHVRFTEKKGLTEDRLAFFNEKLGAWQAILVAHSTGIFKAQLVRNGSDVPGSAKEGTVRIDRPLEHGFVHPDPRHPNRFVWDDGTPEVPIGFDLAWEASKQIPITEQLAKMGQSGCDWTRIWACNWDGKNPWWPSEKQSLAPEQLWSPALEKWDLIERAAERSRVGIQFVLFHHGEFSSTVNPNWPDNPWNAKNGGFLKNPGDFFTDPEAKKRTKIWLRYAVARYGASPSIFGWELFNEVQWVDPIHLEHRWNEVDSWHKEMADYLRSIDVYHHPVTSSSDSEPGFDASLDYLQPHTYPANITSAFMGTAMPLDKPGFFGEFGPGDTAKADLRKAARDGLLAGLLANDAAAGMFWYWDEVEAHNLYSEFAIGRKVASLSDWSAHPRAKIADIRARTGTYSTFVFQPGGGWGKSTQFAFEIPWGADPASLAKISSYFQGQSHRDLMPQPLTLNFSVAQASVMTVQIGEISEQGGSLNVEVDGKDVYSHAFSKGELSGGIDLPIAAGLHKVTLSNEGKDWITLSKISITNAAPGAQAVALADSDWMILRLTRPSLETGTLSVHLSSVPLVDGKFDVTAIDLDSGATRHASAICKESVVSVDLQKDDEMLLFKKVN